MQSVNSSKIGIALRSLFSTRTHSVSARPLGKVRKKVIEKVQHHLTEVGFSVHDNLTSWRTTNVKVDILHFDLLSPAICRKWRVPSGSFSLFPECFFPCLPSLSDALEQCDASNPLPVPVPYMRAQLRFKVFKGIKQTTCPFKTVYAVTDGEDIVDRLVSDIITVIDRKIVPWWSQYDDPAALLRTLQDDDEVAGRDREGPLDIGSKGSHVRLFYLGFAALWMEDYEVALSALTECRASKRWLPVKYAGDLDPTPVLECIDRGILRAKERLDLPSASKT